MQNSRDSSLWRSLAVAFGDGLAFGVGMKLTQSGARQSAAASPDATTLAERLELIEQKLRLIGRAPAAPGGSFDQNVLEAVVHALEARLNEHTAQVERRLADLESRIALDFRALRQQAENLEVRVDCEPATIRKELADANRDFAQSVGARLEQNLSMMRQEMVSINREFAESISGIVADQVSSGKAELEQGLQALREDAAAGDREVAESLPRIASEQVSFQLEACATALQQAIDTRIASVAEERIAPLREELGRKTAQIAGLQQKAGATDANMMEFIIAMGRMCREASERAAVTQPPPAGSEEPGPEPAALEPPAETPSALPVPDFTQPKKAPGLWRVPLVSSFVLAIGGALAMHYL